MRYPAALVIVLLIVSSARAAAPAPASTMHTWTDTQGNTFSGEFVEANKSEVIIRDENGSRAHIPRSTLSAKDLAYADKAETSLPISVNLDVSRVKYSVSQTPPNDGYYIITEN
jgi:hypothetical protein